MCETDLTGLLGAPGLAKKAAQFLINTGELPKFRYTGEASIEDDHVNIGEAEAEDFW